MVLKNLKGMFSFHAWEENPLLGGEPLYKWEPASCISQKSLLRNRFIYH